MVLQPLLLALKGNPLVKYEKIPNDIACFFTFFTTLDNLDQIFPKDHTQFFFFFLLVSNEVCWGIQLILKTLNGIQ